MGQANVPSPNKKTQAHVYFLFLHQERTTNQTNVEEWNRKKINKNPMLNNKIEIKSMKKKLGVDGSGPCV
jgi:uncharacterized protein (DUF2344 family)